MRSVVDGAREPAGAACAAVQARRCTALVAVLQLIHGRGFVKEFYVHSRLRDTLVGICKTRVLLKFRTDFKFTQQIATVCKYACLLLIYISLKWVATKNPSERVRSH